MQTTPQPLALPNIDGRITTATRGMADTRGGLNGVITAASTGIALATVDTLNLVGNIGTFTSATGEAQSGTPIDFAGRITTVVTARSLSYGGLTGLITTTVGGSAAHGTVGLNVTGRITTVASAVGYATETTLSGRIVSTAGATVFYVSPELTGHVFTFASGNVSPLPTFELSAGTIYTRSSATLAPDRLVIAIARSTSWLTSLPLEYQVRFEGSITTTATAYFTPTVDVLSGSIFTAAQLSIQPLPLLQIEEPPYCPVPAELSDYLDLITSEHKPRPNYIASVTASVEPLVEEQALISSMPCLFDLDISVGEQEDFVGQWIGKTRYIHLGNVFFSFDTKGLGWDEANWRGPYDPEDAIATLDDYHYRLLLYSAIVHNQWDGSIPEAYRAWDILFAGSGYKVLIQDNGNMTMLLGLMGTGRIDAVTQALFQGGNMDLRPEGIALIDYVFQAEPGVPFFAWDSLSDSVAGWDIGYWGYLVPPGEGFVPESARMRG